MEYNFNNLPEMVGQVLKKLQHLEDAILDLKLNARPTEPDLVDINKASELLMLSKQTIYGLTSKAMIPHMKQGKRLYFSTQELNQWLIDSKRKTMQEISNDAKQYCSNKMMTNSK